MRDVFNGSSCIVLLGLIELSGAGEVLGVVGIFQTCVGIFETVCHEHRFCNPNHTSIPLVIVFLLSCHSFKCSAPRARS